jgi:hypothetical protein
MIRRLSAAALCAAAMSLCLPARAQTTIPAAPPGASGQNVGSTSPVAIVTGAGVVCDFRSGGNCASSGSGSNASVGTNGASGTPTSSTQIAGQDSVTPTTLVPATINHGDNGFTVHVANLPTTQPISQASPPVGSAAFNAGQVTIAGTSGSPTQIVAPRTGVPGTGRIRLDLIVETATSITICNSSSATSGVTLTATAGETISMLTQAGVWAFVSSGSVSVGFVEYY